MIHFISNTTSSSENFTLSTIEDVVKYFNTNVLNSNPIYKLEFDSWRYSKSDGLSFNTDISSYSKTATIIQNEIAIALLPKDAVNDINSIIERIADKFRVELDSI